MQVCAGAIQMRKHSEGGRDRAHLNTGTASLVGNAIRLVHRSALRNKSCSGWQRTLAPWRISVAVNVLQRIVHVNAKYGHESDFGRSSWL